VSKTNIILIVLDTCRYDVFHKAINDGLLKNIGRLKNDSVYFNNAVAPSPWTTPSHVSLFTGLYPSEHGVHESKTLKQSSIIMTEILKFPGKTLAEEAKEEGYHTYGFVANPNLAPGSGFERGFDYLLYSDMFEYVSELWGNLREEIATKFPNIKDDIINLANNFDISELKNFAKQGTNFFALPWLLMKYKEFVNSIIESEYPIEKGGKNIVSDVRNSFIREPFFLFINFMEMHDPYVLEKGEIFSGEGKRMLKFLAGYSNIKGSRLLEYKDLYLKELIILDRYIGDIVNMLKSERYYDDSVIVITSDHGQSFGENHFYGHGVLLADSLIRIPLIVKLPHQKKIEIAERYQSLVNVNKFLIRCSRELIEPEILSSDVVYSEKFAIQEDFRSMFKLESDLITKLEAFEGRKLAVYSAGKKYYVNISDNEFEIMPGSEAKGPLSKDEMIRIEDLVSDFLGHKFSAAITKLRDCDDLQG
jgi:arylsulfatase A-like enzyme